MCLHDVAGDRGSRTHILEHCFCKSCGQKLMVLAELTAWDFIVSGLSLDLYKSVFVQALALHRLLVKTMFSLGSIKCKLNG